MNSNSIADPVQAGTSTSNIPTTAAERSRLGKQLMSFGEALAAVLPSKLCCNYSGCANFARLSEAALVTGKSCVCGRCEGV
jgi:hypothetical protein